MKSRRRQARQPNGVTLVELVVAMVIISVIGAGAAECLVTSLKASREQEAQTRQARAAEAVLTQVRQACDNLLPFAVGGIPPIGQEINMKTGKRSSFFLTRVPPNYSVELATPDTQAILCRVTSSPCPDGTLEIEYSRERVGAQGLLDSAGGGAPIARGLSAFEIAPAQDGGAGEAKIPQGLKVRIAFAGRDTLSVASEIAIHAGLSE